MKITHSIIKILPFILILFLIFVMGIHAQNSDFQTLTGPYLGQTPPVNEPVLFAPGIVVPAITVAWQLGQLSEGTLTK